MRLLAVGSWVLLSSVVLLSRPSSSLGQSQQLTPAERESIQGWTAEMQKRKNQTWDTSHQASKASQCKYPKFAISVPDVVPYKKIALTFDDGPSPATTLKILDVLLRYKVPATFFVLGKRVAGNEEILERMVREGHLVANHSYSHPNLRTSFKPGPMNELEKTDYLLEPYFGHRPKFIRFPYGNSSCTVENEAERLGYHIVGWDVDTCDWDFSDGIAKTNEQGGCLPNSAKSFSRDFKGWVLSEVRRKNGGVVLFHDVHRVTANHLESIIESLLAEGFEFTSLDSADFPTFRHHLASSVGRLAAK